MTKRGLSLTKDSLDSCWDFFNCLPHRAKTLIIFKGIYYAIETCYQRTRDPICIEAYKTIFEKDLDLKEK